MQEQERHWGSRHGAVGAGTAPADHSGATERCCCCCCQCLAHHPTCSRRLPPAPPACVPLLQYPANALAHRGQLLALITSEKIKSNAQLDGALEYLGKVGGRARHLCRLCCFLCHSASSGAGALAVLTGVVSAGFAGVSGFRQECHRSPTAVLLLCVPQVGSEAVDAAALDEAAGVGVEVGPDQIRAAVAQCVQDNEATLREER